MSEETPNSTAKRLLGALAVTDRLLRDHAVQLRRSSAVAKAHACLEVVSYENGPVLEGYVEAELTSGDTVCWGLDVRWTQASWNLEATLDRKIGDRQETVKELPAESATDFESFLELLGRVLKDLLALDIADAGIAGGL
jgi:hypothetical protein